MSSKSKKTKPDTTPRNPYTYCGDGRFRPFVTCAHVESLAVAGKLLFVHGEDLAWGLADTGRFLARGRPSDCLEDGMELAASSSMLGMKSSVRGFQPLFKSLLHDLKIAEVPSGDSTPQAAAERMWQALNKSIQEHLEEGGARHLAPYVSGFGFSLAAFAAAEVGHSITALRRRQLLALGLDDNTYDAMVDALERIGLARPMIRAGFSHDSGQCEFAMGGPDGLPPRRRVPPDTDGVASLEALALVPWLEEAKSGQERALPYFMADFVNLHAADPKSAVACTVGSTTNAQEIDFLSEQLGIAAEVKLYQAPAAITPQKTATAAGDLRRQLESYRTARVSNIWLVSNLEQDAAERLSQIATKDWGAEDRRRMRVITSFDDLVDALDDAIEGH